MKIKRTALILFLCLVIALLPSCKNNSGFSSSGSELKIGVSGLSGNYNPFYAEGEADKEIISQMFRTIQIKGTDNTLINHSGSISYEFIGEKQVKYTVSIDDGMSFSDGTHITIDDVIFFYHFIADATYDGIYKDWYLNDIEGLKEYYYDDENYEDSLINIENTVAEKYTLSTISLEDYTDYLVKTKLDGKYESADSKTASGQSWKEYIASLGYEREIKELGEKPDEAAWLRLAATAEAEKNPGAYNPEQWYREYLFENYLKSNYLDGADVTQISGIKKINDYTCSILFNSRNINAISQINAMIIPESVYSAEYVKGSSETVKEMTWFAVGSGPYIIAENSENEVKMTYNEFYSDDKAGFRNLKYIDLDTKGYDPIEGVVSGKIDVVRTSADSNSVNSLKDAPIRYFIGNCNFYVSVFFNTRSLDIDTRRALMGLCNPTEYIEGAVGSYYTGLTSPFSVRFEEYPSEITEPYYTEQTYTIYRELKDSPVKKITAYYCGDKNDKEYSFLEFYKNKLSEKGISLDLIIADEENYNAAIYSGKADLWVERVYDGPTIDKFEYFNSLGTLNKTGINLLQIDTLTSSIRSSVGFTNKTAMTEELLKLVMQEAVEYPLYQLQEITVYNTDTIAEDSFEEINEADGFTYLIPKLRPEK
ncbi:MAG: hypothetical protein IJD78_05185 [Clostridia bacterium]|nr:hypothetical protein [Clostridia bacterium]